MKATILFRVDEDNQEEFEAAKEAWPLGLTRYRSEIPDDTLVIGRYSCLPFYKDLEDEIIDAKGGRLANTHAHHRFIADMLWYQHLEGLTPKTWFERGYANVPETEHGYVVKGRTNSRKFKWNTHMHAPTKDHLKAVLQRLWDDPLIADQGLVIREYIPLRQFEEGINGVPITNEWRCFFWGHQLISAGFYWSIAEVAEDMAQIPPEALEHAQKAADILTRQGIPFFVVDVGETAEGDWTVIEINDGQMSGLSMIDPHEFYQNLHTVVFK